MMNVNFGSRFSPSRFSRLLIVTTCSVLVASYVAVLTSEFSKAKDYVLQGGPTIGGDYVVFYTAAHEAANGRAAETYDSQAFGERLQEVGPPNDYHGFTWQYPPTYFFVVLPLATLSFIPGYIFWTGAGAAAFFAALRGTGFRGLFLFVIFAAPSTFHAVITGQNGFMTAVLLIAATFNADKHPILAGLAAAVLTTKPQIGLLLPIAYIAAGCWRAFASAAIGAALLAAASVAVFGAGIWDAFLGGFLGASDNLSAGLFPLHKMVTPFSAARLAGFPAEAAAIFQTAWAVVGAAAVAFVWRRVREPDLRGAILCAGVFLTSPYGYYYELVILAFPAAVLAKRALESGWLKFERVVLAGVFFMPLFMVEPGERFSISVGFVIVITVFASVLRRIWHDHPGSLRLLNSKDLTPRTRNGG